MSTSEQLKAEFAKIRLKIEISSDEISDKFYEKFKSGVSLSDIYKKNY